MAVLAFPAGANLDTGNINLQLTLMLWGAQFVGPRLGGALWALATWMKWIPAIVWFILEPRARGWGLIWLAVSIGLSLLLLPLTIVQFQALFEFGARPIRLDYLVFLWAFVPWWYRRDPERPLAAPGPGCPATLDPAVHRPRALTSGDADPGLADQRPGSRRRAVPRRPVAAATPRWRTRPAPAGTRRAARGRARRPGRRHRSARRR